MNATTVSVDLAKNVFEIAVVDANWMVVERQRLTRTQFERWFNNRDVRLVVMEKRLGSAHYWARTLPAQIEHPLLGCDGSTGSSGSEVRVRSAEKRPLSPGLLPNGRIGRGGGSRENRSRVRSSANPVTGVGSKK